ncbi:hypothetical protein ARMGADRAFT_1087418 [Armillaria gallica]|uniref:Uncharacterized protein n=1 Tax=Armillaria gallica TaxID=47427 RepID=A0A2H3DBA5_ARMGA|nr:hypothetical protein ARMGADRAFT_1087418 [Armillaria gallica]
MPASDATPFEALALSHALDGMGYSSKIDEGTICHDIAIQPVCILASTGPPSSSSVSRSLFFDRKQILVEEKTEAETAYSLRKRAEGWEDNLVCQQQQQQQENWEEPVAFEKIEEDAPMSWVEVGTAILKHLRCQLAPKAIVKQTFSVCFMSVIEDERDKLWARILFIMYLPDI